MSSSIILPKYLAVHEMVFVIKATKDGFLKFNETVKVNK